MNDLITQLEKEFEERFCQPIEIDGTIVSYPYLKGSALEKDFTSFNRTSYARILGKVRDEVLKMKKTVEKSCKEGGVCTTCNKNEAYNQALEDVLKLLSPSK